MQKTESEFGKGLCYNLGLFLAHAERYKEMKQTYAKAGVNISAAEMWFNGASDHLYELEIPEYLVEDLRNRLTHFQEKCLTWGHGFNSLVTEENVTWAIGEAKELLRLIDISIGVNTIVASWD